MMCELNGNEQEEVTKKKLWCVELVIHQWQINGSKQEFCKTQWKKFYYQNLVCVIWGTLITFYQENTHNITFDVFRRFYQRWENTLHGKFRFQNDV